MGSIKRKPQRIEAPDPQQIIDAEMRANRVNTSGPFGSVRWNGNTQETTLSPGMQAMADRMMNLGMQDSQRIEMPSFLNDIAGGVMSNIGNRYGVGGKPDQPQAMPPPQQFQPPTPGGSYMLPADPNSAPDIGQQMQQLRQMIANSRGNYSGVVQNLEMR